MSRVTSTQETRKWARCLGMKSPRINKRGLKTAGVSHIILSRTERGQQPPASFEQLLGYTEVLQLSEEDTNLALELAGYKLRKEPQLPKEPDLWYDLEFLSALYDYAEKDDRRCREL